MIYTPEGAVRHIVHDYAYLVVAGVHTRKGLANPCNHFAERTFLVHCRGMALFFSDRTDDRDVYARDFVEGPFDVTLDA